MPLASTRVARRAAFLAFVACCLGPFGASVAHAKFVAQPMQDSLHTAAARLAMEGGHQCIHDAAHMQSGQAKMLADGIVAQNYHGALAHETEGRLFSAKAAQAMRIVASFESLTATDGACKSIGQKVKSYDGSGNTIECTKQSEILNQTKIDILKNKVIARAFLKFEAVLSVEPIRGALVVPTSCEAYGHAVPSSHKSSGVPSADLVIYVSTSPIGGRTVAFAAACAQDQNERPVAGIINFDTEFLEWNYANEDSDENLALVNTAVHEMTHVLGVSSTQFRKSGRFVTATKRNKAVTMVTTPTVRKYVQDYTGCSSLQGAELEDEGGSGSESSHWERKLYYDELMCGVAGTAYSGLTLGFLHDMNVGYTVAVEKGDQMFYGKATGCGVHDSKCDTVAGGKDVHYCFSTDTQIPYCTPDIKASGFCAVFQQSEDYPAENQYFTSPRFGGATFMDGCPIAIAYSNRKCTVQRDSSSAENTLGFVFEPASRCIQDTKGVIATGFSSSTSVDGPRCFVSRCDSSAVSVRMGSSQTFVKVASGATVNSPSEYKGTVTIADTGRVCALLDSSFAVTAQANTIGGGSGTSPAHSTSSVVLALLLASVVVASAL